MTNQKIAKSQLNTKMPNTFHNWDIEEKFEKAYSEHFSSDLENLKVWNRFKKLFPNSPELYPNYTPENIARWAYHIKEAEKNQGFEKVEVDICDIEKIRLSRCVKTWDGFDIVQKVSYTSIAEAYPGVQVYACGSQVRGDYMEYPVFEFVKQAREKAGMRTDRISDYDYWVHPHAKQCGVLPNYADRFRGKFNPDKMVAIPIHYGEL